MKKKIICVFAIIGLLMVAICINKKINIDKMTMTSYDSTTDIILKSSGWQTVSEMEQYVMTINNFDGEWIAAKDSNFNIPGFEDNLSQEYSYVAGNWKSKNEEGEVVWYRVEVKDSYNILPDNLHMLCSIAYYDGQICMARVCPVWENILRKEYSVNDIVALGDVIVSWPITEDRNHIKKDLNNIKQRLEEKYAN